MKLYLIISETMPNIYIFRNNLIFMKEKLEEIVFFTILVILMILLTLTIVSFYFISSSNVPPLISFFVKYHVFFMFIIAIISLLFGVFSHIVMSKRLDRNKENLKETISALLSMIGNDEKKIINYLVSSNGSSTQYELTKLSGMTKLKIHRALDKMEQNGVITKEKLGKINKVFLNKKFIL